MSGQNTLDSDVRPGWSSSIGGVFLVLGLACFAFALWVPPVVPWVVAGVAALTLGGALLSWHANLASPVS